MGYRGNYSREILEQLIDKKQADQYGFTLFFRNILLDFIQLYHDNEEEFYPINRDHYLTEAWFTYLLIRVMNLFLKYSRHRLNMGNVMLALNGRKHKYPDR
jgi:hypothetical protein